MNDTQTLIREMKENVSKYGRENTTTLLMIQAIEALQKQLQASAAVNQWISVDDNLPSVRVTVLICRAGTPPIERTLGYRDDRCIPPWRYHDGESVRDVTHWMHIPQAPQEQGAKQ